jgi:hypothetical protein
MKPAARRIAPAVSLLLLLAACDAAPLAPTGSGTARPAPRTSAAADEADRPSWEAVEVLEDFTVTLYCADGGQSESVRLTGQIAHRSTFKQTPAGVVLALDQSRPLTLAGVGVESGQPYRVVYREHDWGHYGEAGISGLNRETWTLRNLVTHATFTLTYAIRYAFDENGELTVSREREHAGCKG